MGKSSKTQTQQTQTSSIDPQQREMITDVYNRAKKVADKPYTPYTGSTLAGFTPDQLTAFDMARTAATGNVGGAAMNAAVQGTQNALDYRPQQVSAPGYEAATFRGASAGPASLARSAAIDRGDIRDVRAGSILERDVGAYMNPFLQNVAGNAMADLERSRIIQGMQGADAAKAARAFGGSRHGVADAETNRNFFDVAGKTLTNLYSQGFDNAMGLANSDQARIMQAQTANQGVDSNVANANAGFRQQTGLSNQSAANNMAQFNAGNRQQAGLANQSALNTAASSNAEANMRAQLANQAAGQSAANLGLSAANQMAGLSGQQRQDALTDVATMQGVGSAQQAQTQAQLDDDYRRFLEAQNYDQNQTGFLSNVVYGMPSLGGTSSGSGTTTSTPSAFDSFMKLASVGSRFLPIPSDENIKSGRQPVSGERALRAVENMPMETWRYDPAKGGPDDDGATHIGPMAQTVKKNLGIGNGTSIPVVDAMGANFAATKALAKKVRKLESKKGSK